MYINHKLESLVKQYTCGDIRIRIISNNSVHMKTKDNIGFHKIYIYIRFRMIVLMFYFFYQPQTHILPRPFPYIYTQNQTSVLTTYT